MRVCYLITKPPTDPKFDEALQSLSTDIEKVNVEQVFFFSTATEVASYQSYSKKLSKLVQLADDNDIDLYVCSAGFQARDLTFSELGQHDFQFKGLGQFIAQTTAVDGIRVF